MHSASAASIACSGCVTGAQIKAGSIGAGKVGFTYAGAKTKGGPANSALDVQCTGCVSVAEMKFDQDVDLGGNALKAKAISATSVSAASFLGDGSKLSGIKIPSGECKVAGEVVKGINPDGTLKCVKAIDPSALPKDGIDEISNYLIHNQFVDKTCGKSNVPIPDNNPVGVADTLTFPDIGLAQKLDIEVSLTNSNLKDVTVKVFDPNNVEFLLLNKNATGKSISTAFPGKTKPVKGDLGGWVNKNPKGKWRIVVTDGAFLNNGNDGAIKSWCVSIQTLSNKKVQVKGNLIVDGAITSPTGLEIKGDLTVTGKINGAVHSSGTVITRWGTKKCPTGWQHLYSGQAFSTHYSHHGASDIECIYPGNTGNSLGSSSYDLLYPIKTDHTGGTNWKGGRSVFCARCYTPDKAPCYDLLGSDNCGKGFKAAYRGWAFGGHYTHAGNIERICLERDQPDMSASSGNNNIYASKIHNNSTSTYSYTNNRTIRCSVCCRE